ncbi:MAG: zinc-binding dehydrogenase, partial [Acidobacteriota bacterium]
MKATVLKNGSLEFQEEADAPQPEAGEVLVRSLACGICGSDLHFVQHFEGFAETLVSGDGGAGITTDVEASVVLGHEFAAEIVAYGPQCREELPLGARVTAVPIASRADAVETIGFSPRFPGAYGEFFLLKEEALLEIPEGLGVDVASLTEPMAVGRHAVEEAHLEEGAVPWVVGCGPIGLAVIADLAARSASLGIPAIVASDPSPARRSLAEAMGATHVFDPNEESGQTQWVPHLVRPEVAEPLFDFLPPTPALRQAVIFECVGVPGVLDALMEAAPPKTRLIVVGVCMEPDSIRPALGVTKQLDLRFVLGYSPEEFRSTLEDLAVGRLDPRPMLTGQVGVDGIGEAFDVLARPDEHAKIVVHPWRRGGV